MFFINKWFRPIVINSPSSFYYEYLPSGVLHPYISCYWSSSPNEEYKGPPASSPVIPDACCDIIFETNRRTNDYRIIFCGIFDNTFNTNQDKENPVETFGIRFHASGLYPFFRIPLYHFTNQIVDVHHLYKDIIHLGNRLSAANSVYEKILIVETYMKNILPTTPLTETHMINNLLYSIFIHKGLLSVRELAEQEKIGARKLNRIFLKWIGISPKKFCQIVRFQNTLGYLQQTQSSDWLSTAVELGYHDQAHFIKDFKKHFGNVPSSVNLSEFYNTKLTL